jgi:hypothetical protein
MSEYALDLSTLYIPVRYLMPIGNAKSLMRARRGDASMHHDPSSFDCTTDIQANGPTWLEVLASHARVRPPIDKGENSYAANEPQPDSTGSSPN